VEETCRTAEFEPERDEQAAGSTVWGNIAHGRGVGLMVNSLVERLPRGVRLVDLVPPIPRLTITAVCPHRPDQPAVERFLDIPINDCRSP
jgi:DNA-binding transcriptional LysR family regulator